MSKEIVIQRFSVYWATLGRIGLTKWNKLENIRDIHTLLEFSWIELIRRKMLPRIIKVPPMMNFQSLFLRPYNMSHLFTCLPQMWASAFVRNLERRVTFLPRSYTNYPKRLKYVAIRKKAWNNSFCFHEWYLMQHQYKFVWAVFTLEVLSITASNFRPVRYLVWPFVETSQVSFGFTRIISGTWQALAVFC